MLLVTLASWELGLVSRAHDKPAIHKLTDLARKGVRVVSREAGAGAQELLASSLAGAGIRLDDLNVVAVARGHRAVAQMVATSVGDVGVATRSSAATYGLAFEPLAETRFDLVFSAESASDLRVQTLLDCLSSARFRRDLGAMNGYHTTRTGDPVQGAQT